MHILYDQSFFGVRRAGTTQNVHAFPYTSTLQHFDHLPIELFVFFWSHLLSKLIWQVVLAHDLCGRCMSLMGANSRVDLQESYPHILLSRVLSVLVDPSIIFLLSYQSIYCSCFIGVFHELCSGGWV